MEAFSTLLAICAGNSPVPGEFPAQRAATRSFGVFFDLLWINGWVNIRDAGDLRCYRAHYDVIVMSLWPFMLSVIYYMWAVNGPRSVNIWRTIIRLKIRCSLLQQRITCSAESSFCATVSRIIMCLNKMAWCRTRYKRLFEPKVTRFNDAYLCHQTSMC